MFDTHPQFHEYPEVTLFPRYDCEIVSSEMPSGASWLANCLLELDVALWKPWGADLRGDWRQRGGRRYRYDRSDEAWRRLLPSLRHGREFDFRAAPVPRLTHAWPGIYADPPRTVLFVRDPRDALYSFWQRALRVGLAPPQQSFADFIAAPWFHYPLSRVDFLAVWLGVWQQALAGREHLLLRYEDYRADALGTLRRATDFLGIAATEAALRRAVAVSDYEVARTAEQQLIAKGILNAQFNRAGQAGEWHGTFDTAMHAAVGTRFDTVNQWLDYEPGQAAGDPPLARDAAWLQAMLQAAQAEQWPAQRAQRLMRWLIAASMHGVDG
jgi:Sulfotransferase domain